MTLQRERIFMKAFQCSDFCKIYNAHTLRFSLLQDQIVTKKVHVVG